MVKNLPAVQESRMWSLVWEDPLEKGIATHSTSLAWRIPWTEEPGGLQSMVTQRVEHDWATSTFTFKNKFSALIDIMIVSISEEELWWDIWLDEAKRQSPTPLVKFVNSLVMAICDVPWLPSEIIEYTIVCTRSHSRKIHNLLSSHLDLAGPMKIPDILFPRSSC